MASILSRSNVCASTRLDSLPIQSLIDYDLFTERQYGTIDMRPVFGSVSVTTYLMWGVSRFLKLNREFLPHISDDQVFVSAN